ncbi:T9SS type A sorting domain-containing protein [Hymenobacter cellulosilyticus]|uniref:T9SS type A sorting domain-containing protein n=1 Tax=Hymenobacter cellulosilyticus TaxID=2932248 RepID=A0A8T9Q6R9_9BACT|nr:T9SS type A sorting domain-containing protein [Hymenobacter cellulosilyticus]UOQ73306.1 T9SS type A sorting domain-containing protein [Hymenobacter cellulosilyticus]
MMQPDGRLLVSGLGASFNGQPTPYGLTRLTVDGAVDATYSGLSEGYSPLVVQPNGQLLAVRNNAANVLATSAVVRLNADGSLDTSFSPVATPQSFFNGDDIVTGAVVQPADNKILLYGSFRYVAGQLRMGLARLTNTTLATRNALAIQPLHAYPNPAYEAVTVKLPAAVQARPASLLDLQGRPVRTWTIPARQGEASLSLEALPAGVYLLQVQDAGGVYQQKVMVRH